MTETPSVSRRRLLAAGGVGLGLAAAGCMAPGSERRVTAQLQPPEDELAAAQQEAQSIQQQQLTGNISQAEAQQQLSAIEDDLLGGLIDDATTEAESLGLTVEDSLEPTTLLVAGSEDALFDFLALDLVASFSDSDRFEELQAEQEQQQAQATNQTVQPSG